METIYKKDSKINARVEFKQLYENGLIYCFEKQDKISQVYAPNGEFDLKSEIFADKQSAINWANKILI